MISNTLLRSAQSHWFPSGEQRSCVDDLCPTKWLGPFSLHQFGDDAHQTSLRSRSIMAYSNSPHSGRRRAYSISRSLRCRTIGVIWHARWASPHLLGVVNHAQGAEPSEQTRFRRELPFCISDSGALPREIGFPLGLNLMRARDDRDHRFHPARTLVGHGLGRTGFQMSS